MNYLNESKEKLNELNISFAVLKLTQTALKKSIIDAIFSVRAYFKENSLHNYYEQKLGEQHKVIIDTQILTPEKIFKTKTSLYRPQTKKGDPRIWIYDLKKYVKPDDEIILIIKKTNLYIVNVNRFNLKKLLESSSKNEISDLIADLSSLDNVANELIEKIKKIAVKGFIESGEADKEVGELLERELGINANSSQKPDYKGIELKGKHSAGTRSNLFAKVPNYKHPLSKINHVSEIAENFGYIKNGRKQLYHTISALKPNSLGLYLKVDFNQELLMETSNDKNKIQDFAIWEFSTLIGKLKEKHKKTFWVSAEKKIINTKTFYKYTKIVYTANPNAHLLMDFVENGTVTLEHLIKGRKEKGPLFKIKPESIPLLIPLIKTINLS
jgi:hypothetical protein